MRARSLVTALAIAALTAGCQSPVGKAEAAAARWPYAWSSPAFTRFISDSYGTAAGARTFRDWFDGRCRVTDSRIAAAGGLEKWLRAQSGSDTGALCESVHRLVKRAIPKFSLDRGFEFRYTERYGERQCFLQSVLIAGLLQEAGVNAGVAMVWKNERGQETNLGHAVTLVRLRDGAHIVVDASEQRPFATHRGLFALMNGRYAFLSPGYDERDSRITRWARSTGGEALRGEVTALPVPFVRSQFEYYRGERSPGGLVSKNATKRGLQESQDHLRRARELDPRNPLALYGLWRVSERLGSAAQAAEWRKEALRVYDAGGWAPADLRRG